MTPQGSHTSMKIVFFAQLRERLHTAELSMDTALGSQLPQTVAELREVLSGRGELWRELLTANQCLCAVNQVIVDDQQSLHSGDEVAFFPPVTGG